MCSRVDRFVVLVDGEAIGRPGMREVALTRVKRLALALSAEAAAFPTARIALALVKEDALSDDGAARFTSRKDEILAPLREVDDCAVELAIAARPKDGSEPGAWRN